MMERSTVFGRNNSRQQQQRNDPPPYGYQQQGRGNGAGRGDVVGMDAVALMEVNVGRRNPNSKLGQGAMQCLQDMLVQGEEHNRPRINQNQEMFETVGSFVKSMKEMTKSAELLSQNMQDFARKIADFVPPSLILGLNEQSEAVLKEIESLKPPPEIVNLSQIIAQQPQQQQQKVNVVKPSTPAAPKPPLLFAHPRGPFVLAQPVLVQPKPLLAAGPLDYPPKKGDQSSAAAAGGGHSSPKSLTGTSGYPPNKQSSSDVTDAAAAKEVVVITNAPSSIPTRCPPRPPPPKGYIKNQVDEQEGGQQQQKVNVVTPVVVKPAVVTPPPPIPQKYVIKSVPRPVPPPGWESYKQVSLPEFRAMNKEELTRALEILRARVKYDQDLKAWTANVMAENGKAGAIEDKRRRMKLEQRLIQVKY